MRSEYVPELAHSQAKPQDSKSSVQYIYIYISSEQIRRKPVPEMCHSQTKNQVSQSSAQNKCIYFLQKFSISSTLGIFCLPLLNS